MKKTFMAAFVAAFTAFTVMPVGAATYGSTTSPTTHKKVATSKHQQCVKMRMGSSKSSAAMKSAESWCTAHRDVIKKKTATGY